MTGYSQRSERVETLLVEIKTEKGKLTPAEHRFFANHHFDGAAPAVGDGLEGPLIIARTVEDVLRWFGRI